jgi:hypothetical protein
MGRVRPPPSGALSFEFFRFFRLVPAPSAGGPPGRWIHGGTGVRWLRSFLAHHRLMAFTPPAYRVWAPMREVAEKNERRRKTARQGPSAASAVRGPFFRLFSVFLAQDRRDRRLRWVRPSRHLDGYGANPPQDLDGYNAGALLPARLRRKPRQGSVVSVPVDRC